MADHGDMQQRIRAAAAALDDLDDCWALWADDVRQDAEARRGAAAGDDAALDDVAYDLALAMRERIRQAQHEIVQLAEQLMKVSEAHER